MSSEEAVKPVSLQARKPEPSAPEPAAHVRSTWPAQVTIPICATVAFVTWCGCQIYLSRGPDGVRAMRAMGDATSKALGALNPLPKRSVTLAL